MKSKRRSVCVCAMWSRPIEDVLRREPSAIDARARTWS